MHAATKTRCSQINNFSKKREKRKKNSRIGILNRRHGWFHKAIKSKLFRYLGRECSWQNN